MGTLRQYYGMDFNHTARMHVKSPIGNYALEAVMWFDFADYAALLSYYVPWKGNSLDFFMTLISTLEYGYASMHLDSKATLPCARQAPSAMRIENKPNYEILTQFS
jgi:hypothetical protein